MPRYLLIFLLHFFWLTAATAQDRYVAEVFDEIQTATFTYATKDGENLDLDLYQPVYDPEQERAVLLYVHGGGFSGGTRDNAGTVEFCTKMAHYGYVAVSISYRLTRKDKPGAFGCNCPANEKLNTFQAAVDDVQDATHFLIQHREQFGIDPQKIILAGSSAGAETVLNAAYQPPYCYELDSGPVAYAGVIGMAGAIPDTSVIYTGAAVPSLLFHGTDDNLVPYATAPHHYCKPTEAGYIILNGSYSIAKKLESLNVPYWLHTTCGGAHELASSPMKLYFDIIVDFCNSFVIDQLKETRITIVNGPQKNKDYQQFSFCAE